MHVGIVGTGKMGAAIFKLLSAKPYSITVLAIDEDEAEKNRRKYFERVKRMLKRKRISKEDYRRERDSRTFTARIEELAGAQLVIEAIFEDYAAKVSLFQELESVLDRNAIMVSNTSAIPIASMAEKLWHRDRFCGLHFFHPVRIMKPVEIIKTVHTPPQLVEFLRYFCAQIDKKPFVFMDAPGSVVNIILVYYYVEAFYMLESGFALPSQIDALAKRFFYAGPCESVDTIGLDLFVREFKILSFPGSLFPFRWTENPQEKLPDPENQGREGFYIPHLFRKLLAENRLGKSESRGIYLHEKERPMDDKAEYYIDETGTTPRTAPIQTQEDQDLAAKQLLYAIFNGVIEAYRKGIGSKEDFDLAIKEVLLMKEGPFTMMKNIGINNVQKEFDFLAVHVGKRFRQMVPLC